MVGAMKVSTPTAERTIPGDGGLPLLGYSLDIAQGRMLADLSRYQMYGPVSWLRAFGMKIVSVGGPDAAGEVLQNRDRAFASGPGWSFFIGPFFERGLMLLDFEEHHLHRRIMQEAFTSARLRGYLAAMNHALDVSLDGWPAGPRFRVYPALKQATLDVATRTFMGGELGAESDRLNRAFVDTVRAGTALVRFPVPGLRWWRGLDGRRVLEDYLRPLVAAKRAGDGEDMFSALCHARSEDGDRFTDDDIVNHMIFLLMAAHDTTTITMTSMSYYLAKHPEWQNRCRDESLALGKEQLDFDDLDRLPSLDMVARESMRLITPVPAVARRTVKDTEVLGYPIPKDTHVSVSLYAGHHLPDVWPDPERFDPERFSPARQEDKVHRNAWMPFGNGVHKCIGLHFGMMEIKAAMHQMLLKYRWSVPDGYTMPIDWVSLPRPKDGLPVRLVARG
jgi:cytochrome P450